jgi:response regulator of citrate/malate metabolism
MSIKIYFLTFKNILNKNNILLFDTQMRIAHFRYNKYIKNVKNMEQIGGSNSNKSEKLLIKINKKKEYLLDHFINSLISNNLIKTKFIINSLN